MDVKKIEEICKKYKIENYTINDDGSIDVDGNVNLSTGNIKEIPLNFNKVSGCFWIDGNGITSLKGSPKTVGVDFDCNMNNLTSLEGGPKVVGGVYLCDNNYLTNLKGSAEECKSFRCAKNDLTSLESDLKHIKGKLFVFSDNKIKDFYGFDQNILSNDTMFINDRTPLDSLSLSSNSKEFIHWFNLVKPVKGNKVSLKRLKYIYSNLEKRKSIDGVEIEFIKRFYEIVD